MSQDESPAARARVAAARTVGKEVDFKFVVLIVHVDRAWFDEMGVTIVSRSRFGQKLPLTAISPSATNPGPYGCALGFVGAVDGEPLVGSGRGLPVFFESGSSCGGVGLKLVRAKSTL